MNRAASVALEENEWHVLLGEKECIGEADNAAANNDD
jgi:hypothetical protein